MAQFINTLPLGRVVLGGIKGTATPATGLFGGGIESEGMKALHEHYSQNAKPRCRSLPQLMISHRLSGVGLPWVSP